ncbi:MAG: RpiB/LacA/LacB family sugar-phosphate isomerase [Patescibacteria group bacterium]|nr:RpiB/LacA/LacB family sugar-phosphate isomerase [Patescibacteria group bacterium]
MKIYIGADHNGYQYKQDLTYALQSAGHEVIDDGNVSIDPNDDFPQFAGKVVTDLLVDPDPNARGLLICGSGQGMAMAANRFRGIRASVCWNLEEARASRNDDDSNVLCLSSRYLSIDEAQSIVTTFMQTPFAGAPRFIRRLQELDQLT